MNDKENKSLQQGIKFNKKQNKIKEGFDNIYSLKSQQVLDKTKKITDKSIIDNLKQTYQTTLDEYNVLLKGLSNDTREFIDRTSANNPYLNKYIRFTDGTISYVTNQGVAKPFNSMEIYNAVSGKNGCPSNNTLIQLNISYSSSYIIGSIIPTTPQLIVGSPMVIGMSCGNEGTNVYTNSINNNPSSSYIGCYNDNGTEGKAMTEVGNTTFNNCQQYTVDNGFQFFGAQDIKLDGTINCSVSNDLSNSQKYGLAIEIQPIEIWSSNTAGKSGANMMLTTQGALSVIVNNVSVFSTPNFNSKPSNYFGCYGDNPNRAMELINKGAQSYDNISCQQIAIQKGSTYYALQNSTSGKNAECSVSDDLIQSRRYGKAGNCNKLSDGSYSGGGYSNSIYQTDDATSIYYLMLQDDGNMCVYRGSGPNDNQGGIWCAMTNGKQKNANNNYIASKGKYGSNWIPSGSSLAPGDFVGSNDGSIYLIMQNDGNLVLYTSDTTPGCSQTSDGKKIGSIGENTIYKINNQEGFTIKESMVNNNLGKLSYIDGNSKLYTYPDSNIMLSGSYEFVDKVDSVGNDIPGAAFGDATVEKCKDRCNKMGECYGFAYDNINNACYPKNKQMYPNGQSQMNPNISLYIRNKKVINNPLGVSSVVKNIDTIKYANYTNSGKNVGDSYGLYDATSVEQQNLNNLKTRLDMLSKQIVNSTVDLDDGAKDINIQSRDNITGLSNYLKDYRDTNIKIKEYSNNSNIDNIADDSNIKILQENYNYIFWSGLAVVVVLISTNILRK